ncbi:MAG: pro-sigmaK processing inhibitor BofA family protein [Oscillospiraceae bacterium]
MNTSEAGEIIFYIAVAVSAIVMIVHYLKSGKPAKTALFGMGSGALFLTLLHFFGEYVGFSVPLNFFTAVLSLILGIPGVIILALMGYFGLL